jgi:hypothetical protein
VTVRTWKTRVAWRTRRSSYRHQLPTSSWLETSSWMTQQGRSLPRAKSTRSWARMTPERQTSSVVDLPLQIWQRDVVVRVLFPSSAWHVWLLCVFGYGRLARCGKTDRERGPSALCSRWETDPRLTMQYIPWLVLAKTNSSILFVQLRQVKQAA